MISHRKQIILGMYLPIAYTTARDVHSELRAGKCTRAGSKVMSKTLLPPTEIEEKLSRSEDQTLSLDQDRLQRQKLTEKGISRLELPYKKDLWDKMGAVAPIISGLLIFFAGGYFTYSYNQQQLKVQEIQTIEKFIPHLTGTEQSKKAAILAISSLTDAQLAGKIAALFASQGTVSALKSMAQNGNEKDRMAAEEALSRALDNLSQRENRLTEIESIYRQALQNSDATSFESIDNPTSLIRLAQSYKSAGQPQLSEQLLKRAISLQDTLGQSDSKTTVDAYKKLSELSAARGNRAQTEQYLKKAKAIELKLAQEPAVDSAAPNPDLPVATEKDVQDKGE